MVDSDFTALKEAVQFLYTCKALTGHSDTYVWSVEWEEKYINRFQ